MRGDPTLTRNDASIAAVIDNPPSIVPYDHPPHTNMVWIPGATFRMGSDRHYPEEAPAHQVLVDGFLMDVTPVTDDRFAAFIRATGHATTTERAPDPQLQPGALP